MRNISIRRLFNSFKKMSVDLIRTYLFSEYGFKSIVRLLFRRPHLNVLISGPLFCVYPKDFVHDFKYGKI